VDETTYPLVSQWRWTAGSATPTTRDHKDGTSVGTVPENGLLGRQVWTAAGWATPCTTDAVGAGNRNLEGSKAHAGMSLTDQVLGGQRPRHGPTPSGSPASTAKRGALNPAFVRWLMGFPPAWDACAPTAMPSSRKSRRNSLQPWSVKSRPRVDKHPLQRRLLWDAGEAI
jgi:hypothetical protein